MTELAIPQEISVQTSENRIYSTFGLFYVFWENKYWKITPQDNAWVIQRDVMPHTFLGRGLFFND